MKTTINSRFTFESMKPVSRAELEQVEGGGPVVAGAALALVGLTVYGGYRAYKKFRSVARKHRRRNESLK